MVTPWGKAEVDRAAATNAARFRGTLHSGAITALVSGTYMDSALAYISYHKEQRWADATRRLKNTALQSFHAFLN